MLKSDRRHMLYIAYHCYTDLIDPLRVAAREARRPPTRRSGEMCDAEIGRRVSAAWELIARAGSATSGRPTASTR